MTEETVAGSGSADGTKMDVDSASALLDLVVREATSSPEREALWKEVLAFPTDSPAPFQAENYDHKQPLHLACEREAPPKVLRFLATHVGNPNLTQLILAKMWDEVLQAVASAFDADLDFEDHWCRTPLIWALLDTTTPQTVLDALVTRLPCGARSCETQQRRFALHYAAERIDLHPAGVEEGAQLVIRILAAYPKAGHERDAQVKRGKGAFWSSL